MDALAAVNVLLFEAFRFDRRAGSLSRRDERGALLPLALGPRALAVLDILIARQGDLVSKEEIMQAVWPGTVVEDNNLTVQISALRRVLDQGRGEGSCIQTIAGRGYRFVGTVTREGRGARPRLSIVVLPFTNFSEAREQQYFADGITDDVTTDLSRLANMFVISRNTAFTYRNKTVDTKQIGCELGVRYVLEGSVQRSGKQVRVTAQLIDAETDAHLWAERFDRDAGDLFAVQNEITSRIAVALNLELVGAEAARPTTHPDALDYLLRGRAAHARPHSRENRAEAIGLFERALALDPQSVAAQSYLATALTGRVLDYFTDTAAADLERAKELSERALAASPGSPLAHYAKGQVLRAQSRYNEAISEYETVLTVNRNWVTAYAHIGICKFFSGSTEEAIPLLEQAIRLSPRDPVIGNWYMRIGQVHLLQSRTDEAIVWLEKACSSSPAHPGHHALLASAYALKGETKRAAAELAEARRLCSDDRFSSISRLKALRSFGVPKIRALFEATYLAGLGKAGMPEE